MKKCLLCGHEAFDKEPTCPKCGEATWSAVEATEATGAPSVLPVVKDLPEDKTEPPPIPEAAKPKRGRK